MNAAELAVGQKVTVTGRRGHILPEDRDYSIDLPQMTGTVIAVAPTLPPLVWIQTGGIEGDQWLDDDVRPMWLSTATHDFAPLDAAVREYNEIDRDLDLLNFARIARRRFAARQSVEG